MCRDSHYKDNTVVKPSYTDIGFILYGKGFLKTGIGANSFKWPRKFMTECIISASSGAKYGQNLPDVIEGVW